MARAAKRSQIHMTDADYKALDRAEAHARRLDDLDDEATPNDVSANGLFSLGDVDELMEHAMAGND